jgi:nucleotide-binding universal stress UspA family protein
VVVGVDGSANSITALRRAAREATQAQAALKVVFAYHPRPFGYPIRPPRVEPESGDELAGFGPVHGRRASEDEDEAMQVLRQCVEEAFGDRRPARMQLVAKVGVAHKLLTELAGKGDLLVVGARGHSGTLRFLLGSTAAACANNARCPVLVVPADSAEAAKASRQAAVS